MSTHIAENNGITVIAPEGELDVHNSDELKTHIQNELGKGTSKLLIDLRDVAYMDSAALGVLVSGLKRAREAKAQFKIVNVTAPIERIFRLTRLSKFFEIYGSTQDAVDSFIN